MGLLKTILIIRYLPVLVIGGLFLLNAILLMGAMTAFVVVNGIQRVSHGQSFFRPDPPRKPQPKPTGLSIFMHNALTSPAGRNAARRHLLIPDHSSPRGASSLRSEKSHLGIVHPLGRVPSGNSPV